MTDSVVYAEVDASEIYSKGQMFQIVPATSMLCKIRLKNSGQLPKELSGFYTTVREAKKDIIVHKSIRKDALELAARKKAVQDGKKRHAAKQARLQEAKAEE